MATATRRPPVKINRVFHDLYSRRQRYLVSYGGRRSGKSYGISQDLVRRACESAPRKIVALRKVARTLRLSVWPRLLAAIDESVGLEECAVNRTEMTIALPTGSVFVCVGADDPEKLKSLEGATDYWLEEATEFSETDLDTVDAGLSGHSDWPCQIWLSFNPVPRIPGHTHWLERRFLHVAHDMSRITTHDDVAVLKCWYRDNAFCPPEVARVLEGYEQSNPSLYRMWALGEFTSIEGAILSNWDVVAEVPGGVEQVGYGLDFGYATDPSVLVRLWARHDELWVREELYVSGFTNQQLASVFREDGLASNDIIIADSAEPKSIAELQAEGFSVSACRKGADYKRSAARWLQGKTLHLLEGSTNLIREVASWSWDLDARGNMLPRPADGDDHSVDALIYATDPLRRRVVWGHV